MNISEILSIVWPVILLQIAFQIYAIIDLMNVKKRKTRNLNFSIWIIIIIVGEIAGPALYFTIGRSEE